MIRRALQSVARRRRRHQLPLHGWPASNVATILDALEDADVERLNSMLPWTCFTADGRGRRVGDLAWVGKRDQPQAIPDPRIVMMDERFGLAGSSVLEVGCYEGVHTTALCERARSVLAVDSRVENVVKTVVRTAIYGQRPAVRVVDLDANGALVGIDVDVVHHVGVLYHLARPAEHLLELASVVRRGLMLDTHVAPEERADAQDRVGSTPYRYMTYREGGRDEVFSGMSSTARWLPLDDLIEVLRHAGFDTVDVVEQRAERNGPRVLLFAERS